MTTFALMLAYVADQSETEAAFLLLIFGSCGVLFLCLGVREAIRRARQSKQWKLADSWLLILSLIMTPTCMLMVYKHYPRTGHGIGYDPAKERNYQYTAHKKLGELVARNHPGEHVLVITYSELLNIWDGGRVDDFDNPWVRGVMDGLDNRMKMVSNEAIPIAYWDGDDTEQTFTAEKFNHLLETHKDATVIISLMGLPTDYSKMTVWQVEYQERPGLYIAQANPYDLKHKIKAGIIKSIMIDKPVPVDIMAPLPETEDEVFDRRYLLITPENVDKVDAEYPGIFRPTPAGEEKPTAQP